MDERSNHLGLEQLADYAEQRLAQADQLQIAEHLSACSQCQAELRWVLTTTAALAPDAWQAPPLALRAQARRAFRANRQQTTWRARVLELAAVWQQGVEALREKLTLQPARPALFVALSVLIIFVAFFALQQRKQVQVSVAQAAVTSAVRGDVRVKAVEGELWQPVAAREDGSAANPLYLRPGEEVLTGAASSAELTFFTNSTTLLGEATELVVQQLARRDRAYQVSLAQLRGRIDVSVDPATGETIDFQVETPSALVRVTGTQFAVTVSDARVTEVAVVDGTVVVSAAGVSLDVHPGEAVIVYPGQAPQRVGGGETPSRPAARPTAKPTVLPPGQAKDKDKGKSDEPAAEHTPGPPQDTDSEHTQPTRKPRPEQAEPHPTRKPQPTHVPEPAKGTPPGQDKRSGSDKAADQRARP